MRVVFLSWTSALGGSEKHLVELIQRLDLSKVRPAILCFGRDPFSRVLNDQLRLGIDVKTGLSRTSFLRTWSELRKKKPDVVVFVSGGVSSFPWYTFLAARLAGAKRVCATYGMFPDLPKPVSRNGSWLRYLARRAFGWQVRHMLGLKIVVALTDKSVCVSENLREVLTKSFGHPREKSIAVHNGVDLKFYGSPDPRTATLRQELGMSSEDIVLVCACRLVEIKGIDVLLKAVDSLREEIPRLKCVILGEGSYGEVLRRMCAELNLSSRVFFSGFQDNVRPYLQMADVFVNPSYVECLPRAVVEAMACGIPCIATKVGGVPEIISDQEDGLLVAPGSVGELSAAIERLANNRADRERMGERAREKVRMEFDLERSVERLKAVLLQ